MGCAYIRLNRHMTRLNFAFEQGSSRPTQLAAGFLCIRACSNGPRGAARTQLGSSRLRAPFALRSCPSRECTTAGSSHTRQMQQPGVGPRYSGQLRLSHEYQPRGGYEPACCCGCAARTLRQCRSSVHQANPRKIPSASQLRAWSEQQPWCQQGISDMILAVLSGSAKF